MSSLNIEIDEELHLRSFQAQDANILLKSILANRLHLETWIPWIQSKTDLDQIQRFIIDQQFLLDQQKGFMLGLYRRGELIGMAGLQNWDHQLKLAELGFWLTESETGKGLMKKSLARIIKFGFKNMQLHKITAQFVISNAKAHTTLTKLGFQVEGVLRHQVSHRGQASHLVCMGFLKEEWIH